MFAISLNNVAWLSVSFVMERSNPTSFVLIKNATNICGYDVQGSVRTVWTFEKCSNRLGRIRPQVFSLQAVERKYVCTIHPCSRVWWDYFAQFLHFGYCEGGQVVAFMI